MKKIIAVAAAVVMIICAVCPAAFAADIKFGDTDLNGKVNSSDALKTLQAAAGLVTLSDEAFASADVNADNRANSSDALLILQYATGLISKFPAEKQEEKDPSTIPEILEFYKKVAAQNSGISTAQSFELKELKLNNIPFLFNSMVESIAEDLIKSNTMDVPGFPGDMATLSADDFLTAKYTKNSDGTVTVTMKVKPQSDTIEGSKYEGPTGRAIGVVGDVPQLIADAGVADYVDLSKTTGGIDYSNAVIKIVVDSSLNLVKGKCTWTYTAYGHAEHVNIEYEKIKINDAGGYGTVNYKLAY